MLLIAGSCRCQGVLPQAAVGAASLRWVNEQSLRYITARPICRRGSDIGSEKAESDCVFIFPRSLQSLRESSPAARCGAGGRSGTEYGLPALLGCHDMVVMRLRVSISPSERANYHQILLLMPSSPSEWWSNCCVGGSDRRSCSAVCLGCGMSGTRYHWIHRSKKDYILSRLSSPTEKREKWKCCSKLTVAHSRKAAQAAGAVPGQKPSPGLPIHPDHLLEHHEKARKLIRAFRNAITTFSWVKCGKRTPVRRNLQQLPGGSPPGFSAGRDVQIDSSQGFLLRTNCRRYRGPTLHKRVCSVHQVRGRSAALVHFGRARRGARRAGLRVHCAKQMQQRARYLRNEPGSRALGREQTTRNLQELFEPSKEGEKGTMMSRKSDSRRRQDRESSGRQTKQ